VQIGVCVVAVVFKTERLALTVVVLLFLFCRARWLMPPDVPQPVRLIVFTLL
jgi:hypothetical protein